MTIKEIKGNNLISLADSLFVDYKKHIAQSNDPFNSFTVVVPSQKTASLLKALYLKKEDGALMNFSIISFEEFFKRTLLSVNPNVKNLIDKKTEQTLLLKLLAEDNSLGNVSSYINDGSEEAKPNRLFDASKQLTDLFFEYEDDGIKDFSDLALIFDKVSSTPNLSMSSPLLEKQGRINIKGPLSFFGFSSFSKKEEHFISLLDGDIRIYSLALQNVKDVKNEVTIVGAPSKLREVENLHSEICGLVKKDPSLSFSDFLVVAPSINDYQNIIPRVFSQDGREFPNIPFSISGNSKVDGDVTLVIRKLHEIGTKGFFTRFDFLTLVRNETVMISRGISPEEIEAFTLAILRTNTYRNKRGLESRDDWDYLKKRILSSKLTNSLFSISEGEKTKNYLPFSSIDLDDDAITKFVKIIDDISSFLQTYREYPSASKEAVETIETELDKWFDADNGGKGFAEIKKTFLTWKGLDICSSEIPLDTFFFYLFAVSQVSKGSVGQPFSRGVTFSSFDEKSILAAKYVFFLGANAKDFPSSYPVSELDQSKGVKENRARQTKDAFLSQYQNALVSFRVSYIDTDLKTGGKMFLSPLCIDLFKEKYGVKEIKLRKIGIDESRGWEWIFTKRAFKNKEYFLKLTTEHDKPVKPIESTTPLFNKITIYDIKKYLEEPFKFKFEKLYGKEDETEEEMMDEYEPFTLDNLSCYGIVTNLLSRCLNKGSVDLSIEKVKEEFEGNNIIPDITAEIEETTIEEAMEKTTETFEFVENQFPNGYELRNNPDMVFEQDGIRWVLASPGSYLRAKDSYTYFEIKTLSNAKGIKTNADKFLKLYAISLMDIASIEDDNQIEVTLIVNDCLKCSYSITPEEATSTLHEIYKAINDWNNIKYISFKSLFEDKIHSFDDLVEETFEEKHVVWSYFVDKRMVNRETQLGYNLLHFKEEYDKEKERIKSLVKFSSDVEKQIKQNERKK